MLQQVSTLTKFVYFKMAKILEANNEDGESDRTDTRTRSIFDYNHDHESHRTVERRTPREIFGSYDSGESNDMGTSRRWSGTSDSYNNGKQHFEPHQPQSSTSFDNDLSNCIVL